MRIFHIATAADWRGALATGEYTTSSRGVSLADEGFIHASRADQLAGVYARYYCDEPLVLLHVDTDRLRVPWREDPVGDDSYPHVYGPIHPEAVVDATPLDGPPAPP